MAGKSDYLENEILEWLKGITFAAAPATVYVSLHSAAPDEDASPTNELTSAGSYARAALTTSTGWSSISQGADAATITNAAAVVFPTATANWSAQATHFGIFDASTSGNMLYFGTLTTPRTILNGDPTPTFAIGALTVTEA